MRLNSYNGLQFMPFLRLLRQGTSNLPMDALASVTSLTSLTLQTGCLLSPGTSVSPLASLTLLKFLNQPDHAVS